jgi:hypothetical protein
MNTTRKAAMQQSQREFIDTIIDPIPFFGPIMADLFYTFSGLADAMNLQRLASVAPPLPPGDNVVRLATTPDAMTVRKAA